MAAHDLDLLSTFLEIHLNGSPTATATKHGLSQPTVTGRPARLEQHVGEPLFIRSSRGQNTRSAEATE
ncbi:LysR family transcriptional regulator [Streptosporangium sp. NPDC002544]|uniref:helix-turn-helix domain-containing protein n=1 Tax=Streptosporangium sp. NPDC002544 TaxID=3154538 RepID=UPI00331F2BBA